MNLIPATFVQCRSSGEFMCEDTVNGGSTFTMLITNATPFFDQQEAIDSAVDSLDHDFVLFNCAIWVVQ